MSWHVLVLVLEPANCFSRLEAVPTNGCLAPPLCLAPAELPICRLFGCCWLRRAWTAAEPAPGLAVCHKPWRSVCLLALLHATTGLADPGLTLACKCCIYTICFFQQHSVISLTVWLSLAWLVFQLFFVQLMGGCVFILVFACSRKVFWSCCHLR